METLLEVLTQYAEENLIPRFLRETAAKARVAQHSADQLTDQLNTLGSEAEKWVEALKEEWDTTADIHARATLLAGISIGLELGRL